MDHNHKFSEILKGLSKDRLLTTSPEISLWCSSDNLSNEWFLCNHEYCTKHREFKTLLSHHSGQHRRDYFSKVA